MPATVTSVYGTPGDLVMLPDSVTFTAGDSIRPAIADKPFEARFVSGKFAVEVVECVAFYRDRLFLISSSLAHKLLDVKG